MYSYNFNFNLCLLWAKAFAFLAHPTLPVKPIEFIGEEYI